MSRVVSIHDDEDKLAGTGVLVTDYLVLTCAHVVNIALDRAAERPDRPEAGAVLTIRFEGAPSHSCKAFIDGASDAWSDPPAHRAAGADLCVLRLTEKRPSGTIIARIQTHHFTSAFPARASGYPVDWDKSTSSPNLDIGDCKVMGPAKNQWLVRADDGSRLATVFGRSRGAGLIHRGFSGGPLEKGEYLVGLVAQARQDLAAATAYAIPAVNFPACVLQSASVLSDETVAAKAEVRRAAAAAFRASDRDVASAQTDADENGRQAGRVSAQEDKTEELISFYSALFVGRGEEANRIRLFVWSEERGYLFVKGESGAGKSALLVNLVQQLRSLNTGPVPFLIYHFVRQEQGDLPRVLRSLNAQLAKALGEFGSFMAAPNLEDQFGALWNRLMLHSGRERPVLLVLDGLDELEEPGSLGRWLPGHLGPYTHVVASGRTTFDPLRHLPNFHVARLAGPPISLGPLGRKDVYELLERQVQDSAEAARLVEPVFRVTKGFALTTRLLAKDIAQNGDAALEDETRLAGLMQDYLGEEARHLIESAEHSLRRQVLAVLAEARGPLTPEDLSGILSADQAVIEDALEPILRCLASPTSLGFEHLELKRAVAQRLSAEEKIAAQTGLSRWMRSTAIARGTGAIPAYVLDHFVDQFRATCDLKALASTVVSEHWCASRYAQRGSHGDYINDLDRMREQAVKSGPEWPVLCQTSYVRAQLHTVAANIPSAVLLLLADLGRIDEAVSYAMLQPDPLSRAEILASLSSRYRERGEGDNAAKTLARAEATLEEIASAKKRCSALGLLASRFKDAGDLRSAKKMAKYCRDTVSLVNDHYEIERAEALEEAINASAVAGDYDDAIELVQSQASHFGYYKYLERVVVPFAKGGAFERLLEFMSRAECTWYVKHAIGKAAKRLVSAGFVVEAKRLAGLAPEYPYNALVNICESLALKGDIEDCLSTLGEIGLRSKAELLGYLTGFGRLLCRWNITANWVLRQTRHRYELMADAGRRNALRKIVLYLPGKVAAAEAPALARRLIALVAIEPGMSSIRARAELVGWLAESGAARAALDLAREIRSEAVAFDDLPSRRAATEIGSTALGKAGKWDEAYELLEPLLASGDAGETDQSDRADGIRLRAVESLTRCKRCHEALALCHQIQSLDVRARGLGEVAAELASTDVARAKEITSTALDLARSQNADEEREVTQTEIALAFARRGFAEEAMAAVSTLAESGQKKALSIIVYLLLEAGNIDGAETAALAISDWQVRHKELLFLMRTLLKSQQFERAFATANKDPYDGYRFDALVEWMEVVLAERPPHERNRWLTQALAEAQANVSWHGLHFRGRLGRAMLKAGHRERAEAILAQTLALTRGKPADLRTVYAKLAFACVAGRPEDARSIVSRRLTGEASTQDAALVLAQLGDWDQVALKIRDTSGRLRVKLVAAIGELAARRRANDKARDYLEQLHDCLNRVADAERPIVLTEAARLHLLLGETDRAADLCRRAYEQAQSEGTGKLEIRAGSFARAGQKDLALQCLTVTSESVRRWTQADIATALAESGAYDAAVNLAQATVASEDASGDGLNAMIKASCSKTLATAGRPDLALQLALQLSPDYRVPALIHLAGAHLQADRQAQSKDALSQALAAIPNAEAGPLASARAEAAVMLLSLGQFGRARDEVVRAFSDAVATGTDAFLGTVSAGAAVLVHGLGNGGVWDLIDGLEHAAALLSENGGLQVAAEAA